MSRQKHEDRVSLYEPLRKEMDSVVEDKRLIKSGYPLWTPSDLFKDLRKRGVLNPKRHDALRHDIERLEELDED